MTKKLITAVAATALLLGAASVAAADQTTPGTPGDANCRGQTTAFLAQASKNGLIPEGFRGLGGVSKATGLSVKEIHAIVNAYCSQ